MVLSASVALVIVTVTLRPALLAEKVFIVDPPALIVCSPATTKPADQRKRVKATYETCTVYAGATDYYFRNAAGQRLEFRNSNFPGEKAVQVNVKLVDDSGQSEGPPGPNPFWVGKEFFLIYDDAGNIVEAVPAS